MPKQPKQYTRQEEKDRRAANLMVRFLHILNWVYGYGPDGYGPREPDPPLISVSTPRTCRSDDEHEADYFLATTWIDHEGHEWQYMGDMDGSDDADVKPALWFHVDAPVLHGEIRCSEGNEPLWFKLKCEEEPLFFTKSTSVQIQTLAKHPAVKKLLPRDCCCSDDEEEPHTWTDHVGNKWEYEGPMDGREKYDHRFWLFEGDYGGIECSEGNEPVWFLLKCKQEPLFFTKTRSCQMQKLAEHPAVKKLLPL